MEVKQSEGKVCSSASECQWEKNTEKEQWTETLKINNQKLPVKLDTWAECSVLSLRDLKMLEMKVSGDSMQKSNWTLVMYSGHQMETKGKKTLKRRYKEKVFEMEFQVIEQDAPVDTWKKWD